jgi:oxygen-independent coproporphyrinogen-3 oxidase
MLRSDLIAARVPRYTSYPTAPHFNTNVTASTFRGWLEALPHGEPISLYFHIPFCDSLCWFCGCHTRVVNNYGPVRAYVDLLLKELDIAVSALGPSRPVSHIHFGGGSPTILSAADIDRLTGEIRERFAVLPDAEFAVEIDPRGLNQETVDAFARAGVNRASVGVQDVNPSVQQAVNRWQPMGITRDAVTRLRGAGITKLNIDLMYGLPHQSVSNIRNTVDRAVELEPQRLAVFGYAHVPQMKRHQELIDAAALPDTAERLRQYDAVNAALTDHRYQPIGLDHFALASDPLALAQRAGKLARNFQGYTTDGARGLVGFGASAISSLPQGYAQNATAVPDYRQSLVRGDLPVARGRALTGEDRFRRDIIERLMCDLSVDLEVMAARHDRDPNALRGALNALAPLAAGGIVVADGWLLTIPDEMRAGVRLVCAAFDAYLEVEEGRHAVAV